jgi:polysaccharide export outer membrane protein
MSKCAKYRVFPVILGVSALLLSACAPQSRANHFGKTNQFNASKAGIYKQSGRTHGGLWGMSHRHPHHGHGMRSPMPMFQQWIEYEPKYTLYPGDQVDIVVSSAPELSRTLTVGPDGRIVMPMAQPIMAAGRTFEQVEAGLSAELAKQLRDPRIAVTPRAYSPQQIFVGGEVGQQGTYTLPGPVGAMEAVLMAGGLRPSSKSSQIAVMRRAPNGGMMMRTVNIRDGMRHPAHYNDVIQLRRGDIVFVPKTSIAEAGEWVQAFRSVLPVDFNLSYQFGNNNGGTTVISP